MRSVFKLMVAAVAVAAAVVACGTEDDSSIPGSGAGATSSAGAGGGSSVAECVAVYADLSSSTFDDNTAPGKGCSSDTVTTCKVDMTSLVGSCGLTCKLMAGASDSAQAACVGPCIAEKVKATSSPALSDTCVSCYVDDVACARTFCIGSCGLSPTSAACGVCRAKFGCAASFYGCSGLPVPTGLDLGSAGAGNEPASAGAGGS